MKRTVGKKKIILLVFGGLIMSALMCEPTIRTYATGGTVPVYLTQEATSIDVSIDDEPQTLEQPSTYDEGIWGYLSLMAVCMATLIGTICIIKHNQKDSNEK